MIVTKDLCNDMMFNPMDDKAKGMNMFKVYPDLNILKTPSTVFEAEPYGGIERVVRYILYMYDRRTPLRQIKSYKARKRHAMLLAGYEFEDDIVKEVAKPKRKDKDEDGEPKKYPEGASHMFPIRTMMQGRSNFVNRLSVLFVRMFRSYDFSLLTALEESFHRNIENMYQGDNKAKEDKDVLDYINKSKASIMALYEDIYHSKPDQELISETMMVIHEESMGLNPESMADRLSEGRYLKPLYV
jgi:hypothetical protein